MWTKENLTDLIDARLSGRPLILVSNREPYIHRYAGGGIEWDQPASGVTAALEPIMRACGGVWVAHGSGDADAEVVDANSRLAVPPDDPRFTLCRVWMSREEEMGYYYGLANQALWPLCHVTFTRPSFVPEDWATYRVVNERFANAVLEEAGDEPAIVFIQDFHFALLPRMIKERNPNLIVAQFWHIPWPNPEVFRGFPWKEELLDGMLGSDLLGFHLRLHCQNFLDTVDSTFEARIDRERFEVRRKHKTTTVRPFPISIDFADFSAGAASTATLEDAERWRGELGTSGQLVAIGVDRMDYTKGILERFRALDRFLGMYPEYHERLVFVQIAVPSRSRIREYQELEDQIETLTDEINWRWARRSWRPIHLLKRQYSKARLMGLYRIADCCVVSSLHDGMNLVAKEYVSSRSDEDGMLVLSDFAGASRELADAVIINPFDEVQLAEGMQKALTMSREERRRRMKKMRAVVAENNIYRWTGKILSTLLKFDLGVSAHAAATPMERSVF
jgi:alpha,alpha-trehalose-phosphate synthase [UDP-forming]